MLSYAVLAWAFQTRSLSTPVSPAPYGRNGYEDYVQAAKLLQGEEANVFAAWTPDSKPPERDPEDPDDQGPSPAILALYAKLGKMTPLEVRREELRRYGAVFGLVARGNLKPVFDPRKSVDALTEFPELASFKSVAKFAGRAVSVYAADGQTSRAVEILVDQLTMADGTGRGAIISNLVSVSNVAIALTAFGEILPRMSHADALKVDRAAQNFLARPLAAHATVAAEARYMIDAYRKLMSEKGLNESFFSDFDDEEATAEDKARAKAMAKELNSLTPAARQRMIQSFAEKVMGRVRAMDRVLAGPESRWHDGMAALEVDGVPSDVNGYLMAMMTPIYTTFVDAVARNRTQVRLLSLHARLVAYRWEYGRYPDSVDEIDPLTNEKYLYELRPDGTVRLASKGTRVTGEIELKYKAPVRPEEVQP